LGRQKLGHRKNKPNASAAEIDAEWAKVAKRRLSELRAGSVKAVPGAEVFTKIRERFEN